MSNLCTICAQLTHCKSTNTLVQNDNSANTHFRTVLLQNCKLREHMNQHMAAVAEQQQQQQKQQHSNIDRTRSSNKASVAATMCYNYGRATRWSTAGPSTRTTIFPNFQHVATKVWRAPPKKASMQLRSKPGWHLQSLVLLHPNVAKAFGELNLCCTPRGHWAEEIQDPSGSRFHQIVGCVETRDDVCNDLVLRPPNSKTLPCIIALRIGESP